jgi:hypothetical protein
MMLFGWRIAFLLGALTGVVGVMLRRRMPDPTVFLQRKHAIEEQLADTATLEDDRCVGGGQCTCASGSVHDSSSRSGILCLTGDAAAATVAHAEHALP